MSISLLRILPAIRHRWNAVTLETSYSRGLEGFLVVITVAKKIEDTMLLVIGMGFPFTRRISRD